MKLEFNFNLEQILGFSNHKNEVSEKMIQRIE